VPDIKSEEEEFQEKLNQNIQLLGGVQQTVACNSK
jgi:hypothetical protein